MSGQRFWGWAKQRFETPERFFERFFVINYCPLVFMEESGKNRTPDKLSAEERAPLYAACDRALVAMIDVLSPRYVIGVGAFARDRASGRSCTRAPRARWRTRAGPRRPSRSWSSSV